MNLPLRHNIERYFVYFCFVHENITTESQNKFCQYWDNVNKQMTETSGGEKYVLHKANLSLKYIFDI